MPLPRRRSRLNTSYTVLRAIQLAATIATTALLTLYTVRNIPSPSYQLVIALGSSLWTFLCASTTLLLHLFAYAPPNYNTVALFDCISLAFSAVAATLLALSLSPLTTCSPGNSSSWTSRAETGCVGARTAWAGLVFTGSIFLITAVLGWILQRRRKWEEERDDGDEMEQEFIPTMKTPRLDMVVREESLTEEIERGLRGTPSPVPLAYYGGEGMGMGLRSPRGPGEYWHERGVSVSGGI